MTDHGIPFAAPMVLALLAGGKTVTRRLCTQANSLVDGEPASKEQWEALDWSRKRNLAGLDVTWMVECACGGYHIVTPRYRPGDTFYAKEGLRDIGRITYAADGETAWGPGGVGDEEGWRWKRSTLSARFMPRALARIRGTIISVTPSTPGAVCTPDEALAEGLMLVPRWDSTGRALPPGWEWRGGPGYVLSPLECFRGLWESLCGEWTPDAPVWRIGLEAEK